MNPPPITIAARPEATTVDFVWKVRGCGRAEKRWRSHEKLGGSRSCAGRSRRTNMSPPRTFVKRVNTIYCAFLLGHSQDVGGCPHLQSHRIFALKNTCEPISSSTLSRAAEACTKS